MRRIDNIVLHCTDTPTDTTVSSILRYWREELGWKNPGYHLIIKANGEIVSLLGIDKVSNGVKGHNYNSVHIAYIGGENNRDTRTRAQEQAQIALLKTLKKRFPSAGIKGHRDFPGVTKDCPSFDVAEWLKGIENEL